MRVLVAGATGAMGKQLVPRLAGAGHEVFAMTRNESSEARLSGQGAVPIVADALDRGQVEAAVREAKPDVRRVERQGQARAGLAPYAPVLATGSPGLMTPTPGLHPAGSFLLGP